MARVYASSEHFYRDNEQREWYFAPAAVTEVPNEVAQYMVEQHPQKFTLLHPSQNSPTDEITLPEDEREFETAEVDEPENTRQMKPKRKTTRKR